MNLLNPVKARITDIKTEIDTVKTYTLSLAGSFPAKPGQFNMVGYPGVGEAPISMSSLVRKSCFEHTIRVAGRVTRFLDELKEGDEMLIRGPYGKGWPLREAKGKDVLLVAGGIGLAPIRPVVQAILAKRMLYKGVSLVYGARNEMSILFVDEFPKWEKDISLYLTVDKASKPFTVSRGIRGGWKYHVGLVTDILDSVKVAPDNTVVFICGPEIMMRFICRGLLIRGVSPSRIFLSMERRMKCGIAQCGHCQHFGLFVCKDGPVFSYDEVRGLPDGLL